MDVEVVEGELSEAEAEIVAVGLVEGESLPGDLAGARGAGDARTAFGKVALLHPERPERVLVVGLGARDELTSERLRVAAAHAAKAAQELGMVSLAWLAPAAPDGAAGALVEGTVLGSYRFDRYREADPDAPPPLARLLLLSGGRGREEMADEVRTASVLAHAANRARDLQNLPSNELTPERLAGRATEIAGAHEQVEVEVLDRAAIAERGLGGLTAVARGSATEPRLIVLRHLHGSGPRIGLVGKAVTFDSGGISIKPAAGMHEMKMDMSGGAAVLETVAAVAELGLGIDLVAVVPATENMPGGAAVKPGDVITQLNGKTVQVDNTDAEGRLILADALTYCVRELKAERVIDIATLTGAVIVALGSTYAALISNDDAWAEAVIEAGERSGELVWRLPLHPEYKKLTTGTVADLTNAAAERKAGTIYAGSFLEEFVDGLPWAHLDIAGTAWDTAREYVGKGASGFGVRLLATLLGDLVDA